MSLLIQAANVRYAHGGNQIFEDTSFVLREGDRVALIGENGSGKSTLFRLLARDLTPQGGAVTHRRGLTVGYLRQQSALDPALTVREVVARAAGDPAALEAQLHELEHQLGQPLDDDTMADVVDRYSAVLERLDTVQNTDHEAELAEVLGGLRFPAYRWDQRVGELSGGERKLVDVAQFLLTQPDVLLLDEPDNHFDVEARAWLEHWLTTAYTGAVGLISHDRYMIDRVANAIVELEDGRIREYPGNYTTYLELKRSRLEREADLRELQEREFKKLKASAEQLTQWARQNPKFASRAENQRRKMADERARLDAEPVPILNRRQIKVEFDTGRGSTDVLMADGVAKAYGERTVYRPFDLLLRHGERAGLVGPNGAGKTTLVRMILGEEPPTKGTLRLGPSVTAGYYAQEHETLDLAATPLEMVRKVKALNEQQALSFLIGLLFDRDDAMNRIGALSGGERARLQVGLLILSGANLLILDEPTNNLDMASVEALEDALLDFPGAILTISHDRYFLDKLCTRIIEVNDGVVRDFPGGYSFYSANPDKGTPLTRGMQRVPAPEPAKKRGKAKAAR
ncbi:MAG TPA: ABC-F family ATP-binding cassette domain-containing protein [Thermomicrobiales bacterium]|nr:ABC-F family ATP-binding cassette domain-containing protein [Thermomicrobiales bacterium]